MPQLEETITIRAPIDRVFSAITDPRRIPEWNPNILEVRDISSSPVREGTTWLQVTMVAGRAMNLHCTVGVYRPPHDGLLVISGDQRGRTWTRCREAQGCTEVTQGIEFEVPGGFLGQLAGGFAREAVRREIRQTMERQRAALES